MIASLIESFTNLFRPPATVRYPFEPLEVFPQYRGLIEYTEDKCIACERCGNECPTEAIVWGRDDDGKAIYHYNPYLCIYCGECVRACPKCGEGALRQTDALAVPGTQATEVLKRWEAIVEEAHASQEAYKKKRAAERAAKKAAPAKEAAPAQDASAP